MSHSPRSRQTLIATAVAQTLFIGTASAATLTVTTNADSGAGSLRQAIINAAAGDTITFANPMAGGQTITLTTGEITLGKNLTIDGDINNNGAPDVTLNGNNSSRIFNISYADVDIDGLVFSNGNANQGGAIKANNSYLTINDSNLSGNTANYGGAIWVDASDLALNKSTLSGNIANDSGGAINVSYGYLTIADSTIASNSANSSYGGGIIGFSVTGLIENSTITGNSARYGGGVHWTEEIPPVITPSSVLTSINSTISGNTATLGAGGIEGYGAFIISNTIIANNSQSDCNMSSLSTNVNNFFGDTTCDGTADGNPKLGSLANNGGPTQTMALLAGSPAINAGNNAAASGLTWDQRGSPYSRVVNGQVDIGAYEYRPPAPPSPIPTLSTWARIGMMLAMIATAGFYGRRIKGH